MKRTWPTCTPSMRLVGDVPLVDGLAQHVVGEGRIIQKIIEPMTGPMTRPSPPMIAAVRAKNVTGVG